MGAWGLNTFENDGAMDWLGDFIDDPSEAKILDAFSADPLIIPPTLVGRLMGKKPQEFLAELDGEEVLAAAEVVATILGQPADSNPSELSNIPNVSLSHDISAKALAAIDAILTDSNLKDCWVETEDFEDWIHSVQDLRRRLTADK